MFVSSIPGSCPITQYIFKDIDAADLDQFNEVFKIEDNKLSVILPEEENTYLFQIQALTAQGQ